MYENDMRYNTSCLHILGVKGFSRAAAFTRFLGEKEMVSMHIGSSLKMWSFGSEVCVPDERLELRGHVNNKQFVGLAVR